MLRAVIRSPLTPVARTPLDAGDSAVAPSPSESQLLIEGGTDALLIEGGTDALLLEA